MANGEETKLGKIVYHILITPMVVAGAISLICYIIINIVPFINSIATFFSQHITIVIG
jgi:hypothetical protein